MRSRCRSRGFDKYSTCGSQAVAGPGPQSSGPVGQDLPHDLIRLVQGQIYNLQETTVFPTKYRGLSGRIFPSIQ